MQVVTQVALGAPAAPPSVALAALAAAGIVERLAAPEHTLHLVFDGEAGGGRIDRRPALPLILRW